MMSKDLQLVGDFIIFFAVGAHGYDFMTCCRLSVILLPIVRYLI